MSTEQCTQCHQHPTRCLCIAEQIKAGFASLFEAETWQVTSVEPCSFDARIAIHAAYLVSLVARRDIDGVNKQGCYELARQGTVVQYEVYVQKDGKVIPSSFRLPNAPPASNIIRLQ